MPPTSTSATEPWRPVNDIVGSQKLAIRSFTRLLRRASNEDGSEKMINLVIIILGLTFLALILLSLLLLFRRRRQRLQRTKAQENLGQMSKHQKTLSSSTVGSNIHGLTIETSVNGRSSVFYLDRDGKPMLQNPQSPPHSPDNVPEIHITFPEEQDDQGRPKSGRVLVVRVGDNATIGLEPIGNEQLPAYEKEAHGQFQSIDVDQIGGLKEKERPMFQ
ncbi:hypothetical protein CDD82_7050 [Ophiocordyceps australis]|uniref:Uncharacterized protein n=1 Tax=Ophiocordyceps australis TaxID=1399860 RepID=A0A2C5YT79_9HYPO|nr:hypothetical protein CDD82_7050 [Ophiocordyceps australis]